MEEEGFCKAYLKRIKLAEDGEEGEEGFLKKYPNPTKEKLCILVESHLKSIPFENLSQHGSNIFGIAGLDLKETAQKILRHSRGGVCFELNRMFACLLEEFGYRVSRVPATVWVPGVGFDRPRSHVNLAVTIKNETSMVDELWFVDVGFGEPPLHPIKYEYDLEQITPEGMISRLTKANDSDFVFLEWKIGDTWHQRLKWSEKAAYAKNEPEASFQDIVDVTFGKESIFTLKSIVCIVTRDYKISLAGNKLKITGSPRFLKDMAQVPVIEKYYETEDLARKVMEEYFGIPFDSSKGFSFEISTQARPEVWTHL